MIMQFELPEEAVRDAIKKAVNGFLYQNNYGEISGTLYAHIKNTAVTEASRVIAAMDLKAIIQEEIDRSLLPILQEVVRKTIASEARRQVKLALSDPGGCAGV